MSARPLDPHPGQGRGRVVDARLHLMDRTVVDPDLVPLSVVDDVEIDLGPERPCIASLLLGNGVLVRFTRAEAPRHRRYRVGWRDVADVGTAIRLGVSRDAVDVTWVEAWLRRRVLSRIPGGLRDPE